MFKYLIFAFMALISTGMTLNAQESEKPEKEEVSLAGLSFRCVGPALTSGRVADMAMHPDNPFVYYVAVASGGVWKTVNNGTTFTPIFDSQASYSIGCVTIDPSNPNTIWVGTGENNNQRSVAYGDGVYKSIDGGNTWKNMGLKTSEHIGKVIVHPDNSDMIYIASMGPLWSAGGERGVYVSNNGGETWEASLEIDEHTGVSDLVMDPRDPNVMYAAAQQRRRHTFTYVGGGKESTIYKTTDGGASWNKVESGLPAGKMGRIGLAISPANPDYVYAIVEAAEGKGGTFLSTNGGASWSKRGSYATSGNYYQEIVCDPKDEHKLYSMNTWLHVSKDGGKTWKRTGEKTKHVDNHCMWINPNNTDHWIVGCDGGIYDTYDAAKTWHFKTNLPITQFYKVSVDNDLPFYNIYGGTQDNNSMFGPSRTATKHGIRNQDWTLTHGGDGFESVADPQNPNIVYAQSQYGVLVRYDRLNGEEVGIQPKERKGEMAYRWNWDSPLIASPHQSGRVYFAANKVFRSNDYGNSWEVISDNLTKQINRNTLKVMGRVQSVDAVMKNASTSPYGTIVALSESSIDPNLLVAGSDDGLIHVTSDGGASWTKIENISGVPANTYVNAVYCSNHDPNVIYAAFNHHKFGDFMPYLYKSSDKGGTWTSISNNLPERGSVYAIEEDHVDPNLLFCGTEFGVFYSNDGGMKWRQLKKGVPTIAVRDIAIQRRENDLVLGTFGRGFYVMDDYSPLRSLGEQDLAESKVLPIRDALQFEQSAPIGLSGKSMMGDSYYTADNLDPVALINYYVKDAPSTIKKDRQKEEKKAITENMDTPYPTYEEYKAENEEAKSGLLFTIKNDKGEIVRKLTAPHSNGIQRIEWDLRYPAKDPVSIKKAGWKSPWDSRSYGPLVQPGTYTVTMESYKGGKFTQLGDAVSFEVKPLDAAILPMPNSDEKEAFQREVAELNRSMSGAQRLIGEMDNKLKHIKAAINLINVPSDEMMNDVLDLQQQLKDARVLLNGDSYKTKLDIDQIPSPSSRLGWIRYEQRNSRAAVTETHKMSLAIAKEEFKPILDQLQKMAETDIPAIEAKLEAADAPYTPGRAIEMMRGY